MFNIKSWFKKKEPALEIDKTANDLSLQVFNLDSRFYSFFNKVKQDIGKLSQWVFYLNSQSEQANNCISQLNSKLDSKTLNLAEKADLKAIKVDLNALQSANLQVNQQISELNIALNRMSKSVEASDLGQKVLSEQIHALQRSMNSISAAHLNAQKAGEHLQTQQHMQQIILKTQSNSQRNSEITPQLHDVIENDAWLHQITGLSSSEKAILKILYSSDTPVTYSHISGKTKLNYGTVKNIICRLRKKHISVEDQVSPQGEKEFFLPKMAKIALTGR